MNNRYNNLEMLKRNRKRIREQRNFLPMIEKWSSSALHLECEKAANQMLQGVYDRILQDGEQSEQNTGRYN